MKKNGFHSALNFRSAAVLLATVLLFGCGGSAEVSLWQVAPASANGSITTAGIVDDQESAITSAEEPVAEGEVDHEDLAALRIMAVGDSITHGYGGASSYRKPLIELLESSGCKFEMVGSMTKNLPPTGFESPHEAYSGHRTDAFLTGQQSSFGNNEGISESMAEFTPKLILMNLGTNDMNQNRDIDNVIANIDQIVALIFDAEPTAQVVLATLVPYFRSADPDDAVNIRLEQLSNALEAWVAQAANPRVYLIDTREGFTVDMMLPDLIHPGDSGDAFIADKFHQSIADNNLCG